MEKIVHQTLSATIPEGIEQDHLTSAVLHHGTDRSVHLIDEDEDLYRFSCGTRGEKKGWFQNGILADRAVECKSQVSFSRTFIPKEPLSCLPLLNRVGSPRRRVLSCMAAIVRRKQVHITIIPLAESGASAPCHPGTGRKYFSDDGTYRRSRNLGSEVGLSWAESNGGLRTTQVHMRTVPRRTIPAKPF
ncbi:hypothetical protein BX600DRAFT_66952 [Xylariales sp. PMI_506]|nr:hypothetical protein BX600DRAFT_66952 [Xylariales sp. PMI_506]